MDPSEEKKPENTSLANKKSKLILVLIIFTSLAVIAAGSVYYFSTNNNNDANQSSSNTVRPTAPPSSQPPTVDKNTITPSTPDDSALQKFSSKKQNPLQPVQLPTQPTVDEKFDVEAVPLPEFKPKRKMAEVVSSCDEPTQRIENFYKQLDKKPYMEGFNLNTSSSSHFSSLSKKLLANPPQVTRESDDLYTILRNTAHFFRVSGKKNILMMKGILDNEKGSIEKILASYYFLLTTPECSTTKYARGINKDALYEYACFFLNTMGGRLYLFRRDSLSRMVVTYYAILLVDQANTESNNRHGIALNPPVNMLITEMETGGAALQYSATYLDKLYDLKEKYQ